MNFERVDDQLRVFLDPQIISEDVLFKCLYWYTKKMTFNVRILPSGFYEVCFIIPISFSEYDLESFSQQFFHELLDCKMQEIVNRETKTIRELLIAKAFANYEDDVSPQTRVTDPVGFDPSII